MSTVHLRHAVRAVILDEDDRILLCRFVFAKPDGPMVVWAAPGGGVEAGESLLTALRRELREEVGLTCAADPPHVWHQVVLDPGHAAGFDGVINDYFLIRTASFDPRGALSDDELAAENVTRFEWWRPQHIIGYRGAELFSPRDLAGALATLLSGGPPETPVRLGE
ncbi:NUDIX hydrolase [Streptomyces sp. NBC_01198]|uniref:NUDIX hydrolase n=1 Tax=Streptomyces sp. NBC_01198 TaxID=2903769 RepID=UPI002E11CD31|nr:NUDIX domain-containing protein [Streptomyces sp. NBC_01198]